MIGWFKKRKKKDAKVEPVAKSVEQVPKEVGSAKAMSHTRRTHPEWEELFLRVGPSTELHAVKQRIFCEKRKYIVGKNRYVIYLEDKYNPEVNAFITKYYDELARKFKRIGFIFIYAPKELEKVANEYAAPIPNVEWNAETILDLFYCRIHEPIGSTIVVLDETRNYRYAFPERSIIGALMGVRLDADTEEGLMAIFKAYWSQLEKEYCTSSTTARSLIMEIRPEDEKRVVTGNFFTRDGESAQAQRDEELRLQRMQKIREAEERKYSIQSEKQKNAGGGLFSEIVKKIHTPAREFDEFSYDFLTEDDKSLEYKLEEEEKPKRNIAAVAKTLYYGDPNPQRDEEIRKLRERKIRETESRKMSCQPPKSRGGYLSGLARKMKEVTNNIDTLANDFLIEEEQSETLTQEDKQLLREIQERIERLHHSGIRQQLIEQMVRMTVKPSVLQVGDDARLLLTNYNKEVNMLPIDKLVYIFFLRHPEGVALKDMSDHKEELTGLYQRVLGREKLSKTQSKSVDLLCDPLNNSINEKLSRIRQAFRAVAHDSVANCYVIQGERGEKRSITLSDEYIELGEWGK